MIYNKLYNYIIIYNKFTSPFTLIANFNYTLSLKIKFLSRSEWLFSIQKLLLLLLLLEEEEEEEESKANTIILLINENKNQRMTLE